MDDLSQNYVRIVYAHLYTALPIMITYPIRLSPSGTCPRKRKPSSAANNTCV